MQIGMTYSVLTDKKTSIALVSIGKRIHDLNTFPVNLNRFMSLKIGKTIYELFNNGMNPFYMEGLMMMGYYYFLRILGRFLILFLGESLKIIIQLMNIYHISLPRLLPYQFQRKYQDIFWEEKILVEEIYELLFQLWHRIFTITLRYLT